MFLKSFYKQIKEDTPPGSGRINVQKLVILGYQSKFAEALHPVKKQHYGPTSLWHNLASVQSVFKNHSTLLLIYTRCLFFKNHSTLQLIYTRCLFLLIVHLGHHKIFSTMTVLSNVVSTGSSFNKALAWSERCFEPNQTCRGSHGLTPLTFPYHCPPI